MHNVAIIPARGGSKRIFRKNTRNFLNKPVIAYSIEAALQSEVFERVIVSTDDAEIAEIAQHYGAEVPFFRPAELSDDYVGTTEVISHAVDCIQIGEQKLDAICCIYATAPLIQKKDIIEGLKILNMGEWQYVFSATSFGFSIFRGFEKKKNNQIKMFFPEHFQTRSQDLPHAMHDAGQFYWGRPQAWRQKLRLFDRWSTIIELPRWRVQDIDTYEDWRRAEIIYEVLKLGQY